MKQTTDTPDKLVMLTLLCCLLLIGLGLAARHVLNRAENSYLAMARGQYKLARDYYEIEVETGSPRAMNHLANLHYVGLGIERDLDLAAQLYLEASSKGFAPAQLNLGHLYRQGLGVEQDAIRAFRWYSMSSISGNPSAELYLNQTAIEFTLNPVQIELAAEQWPTLGSLVNEGL